MTFSGLFINIAFIVFAIEDLKNYKVKNEMIITAIIFYIFYFLVANGINQSTFQKIIINFVIFIISQAIFIFLSIIFDMPFGDCKLIGLILVMLGIDDGLCVICIGSFLALLPLTLITQKVPMAPFFYAGYLIHFLIFKGVLA